MQEPTSTRTVRTQAELDAALGDTSVTAVLIDSTRGVWLSITGTAQKRASGSATVRASGSATVEASGSATVEASGSATVEAYDSATVEAYDSATVRASGSATVRAYGSATVEAYGSATVEASGSATVRASGSATVEAYGSATVRAYGSATVEASGSATVEAYGSATVRAGSHVAVHLHSAQATISGGVIIDITELDLTDPATWIGYTGANIDDGRVTLYKATGDDLTMGEEYGHPTTYTVGADLVCVDWRDDNECGGGLHLSPTPGQASDYHLSATRWLRCTADVADVRPIPGGTAKCKVRALRVEAEVDRFARDLAVQS